VKKESSVFENHNHEAMSFCEAFLSQECHQPKYVFGVSEYAIALSRQTRIDGFVDDLHDIDNVEGFPVIHSENLPKNALVVVVALMSPNTLHLKLQMKGIRHIHYIAMMRFSGLSLPLPWFWEGFYEDFSKHQSFYEKLSNQFVDDDSRQTYLNIINFRLTGHFKYLEIFNENQKNQYFEPFLELQKKDEVFVDVGGFDGQSALDFIQHCPEYKTIHICEPEKQNMSMIQSRCQGLRDIEYHPVGLSDQKRVLSMKASGSTSRIVGTDDGDYQIDLMPLDDLIHSDVSFIKMDIEGGEQDALLGAKELIKRCKPKLAICVYHQGTDFRVIYQKIMELVPDYQVYLRHYTEGIVETVMFFIPVAKLQNN